MNAAQSTPRAPRLLVLEPWKIWALLGIVVLLGVGSATAWALTSRVRPTAPEASAPVSAPVAPSIEPSALAPEAVKELAVSLTRTVDVPGRFLIEVTYGDPLLLRALGERTPVLASGGVALAFLFNESVHEGELPAERLAPLLRVDGSAPQAPAETVVQIEDPHHRVTVFLYPATALPADGAFHTLSLVFEGERAPGADAASLTWRLPLPQEGTAVQTLTEPPAALAPMVTSELARMLTRNAEDVEYGGVRGVQVQATYATADYLRQTAGADAAARYATGETVSFLVAETSHTEALPREPLRPTLRLDGKPFVALDQQTVTDSSHHRVILVRYPKDPSFGRGRQMMELALPSGQTLQWRLPLVVSSSAAAAASGGFRLTWVSVLAILGGLLAAMWPCLFQLTAYFIPTMAGVNVHGGGGSGAAVAQTATRVSVLKTALFFVLGFTVVYTAAGAIIGFGAQQLGQFPSYQVWLRYISIGAGIILFGLALRVAARARMPLVCKMPVLSRMSGKTASPWENMVAGLAFATGCMTCFGSAVLIGVFLYAGIAASPLYGALILFLFSLGMGIPLVAGALAMARVLPLLFRIESLARWMGFASAAIIATFGVLMISGNFMLVSEFAFKLLPVGRGALPLP